LGGVHRLGNSQTQESWTSLGNEVVDHDALKAKNGLPIQGKNVYRKKITVN
jgi:hypothetical protein